MTLGDEFQKALRNLVIATVVLFVLLAALSGYVIASASAQSNKLAAAIETTNGALCALRDDLTVRVESSENFLNANPEGIPGIPPQTIKEGIVNQRRTIDALRGLDCGPILK